MRSSLKHVKGEGGCCGGSGDLKPIKKKLEGKKIGEKVISIEGMHCENCTNRVQERINSIDGVSAKMNLRKKTAVVSFDRNISDEALKQAVEQAGYTVVGIESR